MIDIEKAIELFKHHELVKFIIPNCGEREYKTAEFSEMVEALEKQLNNGWIPVSEELPEEHRCSDEDDCYRMSEHVLCSAYNEDINEYETWIDYTVDGEWQTHEYYEGEKLAWQPLPEPWKGVSE